MAIKRKMKARKGNKIRESKLESALGAETASNWAAKKPKPYRSMRDRRTNRLILAMPGTQVAVRSLPSGMEEKQLRQYFAQFGKLNGVHLERSKKTGNSRGRGMVEFEDPEVAKIAADTMNNYLMFDTILKCEIVKSAKLKKSVASRRWSRARPKRQALRHAAIQNRPTRSTPNVSRALAKLRKKMEVKNATLKKAGVHYEFPLPSPGKGEAFKVPSGEKQEPNETGTSSAYSLLVDSEDDEISFRFPLIPPDNQNEHFVVDVTFVLRHKRNGDDRKNHLVLIARRPSKTPPQAKRKSLSKIVAAIKKDPAQVLPVKKRTKKTTKKRKVSSK